MWGYSSSTNIQSAPSSTKGGQRKPLANITNSNRNISYPPAEKMFFQNPPQERNCVRFKPQQCDDIIEDDDFIYKINGNSDW